MQRSGVALLTLLWLLTGCTLDPEVRKQRLVETGNRYYEAGKFREASIIYRRAIQQDRRYGEAYYRLGLAENSLGRTAAAINALARATELQPDNLDAFAELADLYLLIYAGDPARRETYVREINRLTERAEENFPGSFDVLRVRGFVDLTERNFEQAAERFRAARDQRPDDQQVAIGLVQALDSSGEIDEAEKLARQFIADHPHEPGMYDFLYMRLFTRNRRDEALELLKLKRENNREQAAFWVQLARHYFVMGDRQRMDDVLNNLLTQPDKQSQAYSLAGDFYMRVGEFSKAVDAYRLGADASPTERLLYQNRMVEAFALQGNTDEAFALLEQVLAADSDNSQALALRGALKLRTGNREELEEAITDFESVLTRMPENVVLRYNLAEAYLADGQPDRAIVEFQEAIKRRPDYLPPRFGLARVHLIGREYARVVAVTEEILQVRPNDVRAKLTRSLAWINMGEQDQARASLEELLAQDPSASEPTYQLARLNLLQRRYQEAERLFGKLASFNPPDQRGIVGLVDAYIAQGRSEEGLRMLEQKIAEEPNNLFWRRAMGTAAARTKAFERAVTELSYVLDKEPNDYISHKQLASVYYQTKKLGEAQQHFQRAADLNPRDPAPFLYLGLMQEARGELQQAATNYEKVVELSPNNTIALNNLAYILAETTADLDRALTLVQRARSLSPDNVDIADTLSWIYIKKNLNDSAIRILEENLTKHPNHVTWRYHLAMAFYQKGDLDRARAELQSALGNNPTREEEDNIRRLLAKVSS